MCIVCHGWLLKSKQAFVLVSGASAHCIFILAMFMGQYKQTVTKQTLGSMQGSDYFGSDNPKSRLAPTTRPHSIMYPPAILQTLFHQQCGTAQFLLASRSQEHTSELQS